MKTEHRHELKTNELSKVAVEVESFYERHATSLQWGIIGIAFVIACGIYYWRTTAAIEAAAWNELSQSEWAAEFTLGGSPEKFERVAQDYASSRAAPWAKLGEAKMYLKSALQDAFTNREKATADLTKAKAILSDLSKAGGPAELREQVLFSLARALEMTSDGDLKPAIDTYDRLLKEIPETSFKEDAEKRIKELSTDEAKEFYAFFSKQNPKPVDSPKPNDSKGGKGVVDPFNPLSPGLKDLRESILQDEENKMPLLSPPKLPDASTTGESKGTDDKAATKDDSPAVPVDSKEEGKAAPDAKETPAETPAVPEKKTEEAPAKEPAKSDAAPAETKSTDAAPEKKAE